MPGRTTRSPGCSPATPPPTSPSTIKDGVASLLDELQEAGADDQVATLARSLPALGMFDQFMTIGDHQNRFRF
jgi:hypothetical protein